MTVMVVGGCGFIGLNVAEAYLRAGQAVVLYDRNPLNPVAAEQFDLLSGRLAVVAGDVASGETMQRAMQAHDVDRLFYGAALTSGPARERSDPGAIFAVNLAGLANAIRAAHGAGVRRVINIGSGSAYGAVRNFGDTSRPLVEDEAASEPETLYAISKLAGERAARRLRALLGIDIVNVRLAAAYGPWEIDSGARDTLSPFMQTAKLALEGGSAILPWRDLQDWTYSRHIAQGLAALMEATTLPPDLDHVVATKPVSVADWCDRLGRAYPAFSCSIAEEGETANINLHSGRNRVPLSGQRLKQDVGYAPPEDADVAYSDFMAWIEHCGRFWQA